LSVLVWIKFGIFGNRIISDSLQCHCTLYIYGNKEEDKVFLKLASSFGLVVKVNPTVKTIFQAPKLGTKFVGNSNLALLHML